MAMLMGRLIGFMSLSFLERGDFSSSHHLALSCCFEHDLFQEPVSTPAFAGACFLGSCSSASTRKGAFAFEEKIDGAGRLAALADGPDHKRLSATHVAAGEYLIDRGAV